METNYYITYCGYVGIMEKNGKEMDTSIWYIEAGHLWISICNNPSWRSACKRVSIFGSSKLNLTMVLQH